MFAYNEHKFILGNLEVVNEFDTKSFQANASSYIKGDINSINFKTSFYSKSIASAIDGLKDITLDKEAVRDFAKLNVTSRTLLPIRPIDYSDITSISPDYLTTYSNKVRDFTARVVKDGGDNVSRSEADAVINDSFILAKKNIVKTTLDYRLPLNMIIGSTDKVKKIIPDTKYISSTVLPFVNGFEKTRANLSQEGKDLLVAVTTAENDIETTIGIANKFAKTSNDPGKYLAKVKYIEYNGVYNTINLMSYVSYMYIRKVNEFRENVLNCNRLYTDLVNGNNVDIKESSEIGINPGVISTNPSNLGFYLMQGNVAAYEVLANKVYELYSGKNKVSDIDDVVRLGDDSADPATGQYTQGQVKYNRNVYDNIKKVFIGIGQGLYDICQIPDGLMIKRQSLADKDIMNEADIISNAGFRIPLKDKFRAALSDITDVSKIHYADFVSQFGVDCATVDELLSEVHDFGNNMQAISNEAIDAYAVLQEIIKRFDYNINNEFKDVDCVKEIEEWAKLFDDEYVEFVNTIAGKFMERLAQLAITLKHIDNELESPNPNVDIVTKAFNLLDIRDYTEGVTEMAYDYNSMLNHEKFEALEKAYQILKIKKDTGYDLIFEADEVEKPTDKAKFTSQFSANSSNAIDKLKAMISKWFTDLSTKFKDALTQLSNNDTVKNINTNSNKIVNDIDYNTIPPVEMYPYNVMGTTAIVDNINKLRNNIKAFNPQTIQNINSEADLYQKLFPFVSGFNSNGDLNSQFLWFNKTGNANPSQVKQFAGTELKDFVSSDMLPFVRDYTTTYGNTLNEAINGLKDDLTNTVNQYKTVVSEPKTQTIQTTTTEIKRESALFEADEPNKNTQGSMSQKAGWMDKAVQLYCGSTLNAVRDRYNDYVGILGKLANVNTEPIQTV